MLINNIINKINSVLIYIITVRPSSPDTWLSRKLSSCSMSNPENTFMFRRLSSSSSSNSDSSRRYSTCSSDSEAGFFQPGYINNFYQHKNYHKMIKNRNKSRTLLVVRKFHIFLHSEYLFLYKMYAPLTAFDS